jgi:release factor glutamine methyltransferase
LSSSIPTESPGPRSGIEIEYRCGETFRKIDISDGIDHLIECIVTKAHPGCAVLPAALAVAKRNAARIGLPNLRFFAGDWYASLPGARFDAIASNPPYVAEGDPALARLAHEPQLALAAGPDGLEALATVAAGAAAQLAPGGRLLLEHGAGQGEAVRALLRAAGFEGVETCRDLAGHERVTEGARPRKALESAPSTEAKR